MPNDGYFDFKRDIEIEEAGGFFCHACAVGKPVSEASPDPRYCRGCYEFLVKEAELLPVGKRPGWIPKPQQKPQRPQNDDKKLYPMSQDVVLIMSPIKGKKSEVDIIQPSVGKVTREKRGPKHKPLPQELIMQWSGEGIGSKAIAARLNAEHGIKVSYKTIQRVLSGERKQLALPISAT